MDPDNGRCYIINLRLMRITGLYQLLDPNTARRCGVNLYKLCGSVSVLYLALVMAMCHMSVYYSLSDFAEVVKYVMLIIATLFALIKMCFIIRNSDALWELVGFTSMDLLSYGGHRRAILADARAMSIRASKIITSVWIAVITVWILSPIIINGNYINVTSANGTCTRRYRYNMLNLLFPVSDEFYNGNFKLFYSLETVALLFYGYSMMSFDYLVISMCIAIAYQLKTIATSYSTLGHDRCLKSEEHLSLSDKTNDLNNLKLIIQDHQKFIKKMHEIYIVMRPIILFQLSIESLLITLQPFLTVLNLNRGMSLTSPESIKLISSSLTNIVHLFLTCYLFCMIDKCKDSMNFALYNCNWTEMNIKFKKLLLLTMQVNNTENLQLKATTQMVVNLELFSNVMHTTYKIISVLVNQYTST